MTQAAALADRMAAPVNSPLTPANVSWAGDVRLKEGQTATFNATTSAATTASAVVNTTGSFSVAGWVRLGALPTIDMKFATQDGTDGAGFEIGVRRSGSPLVPHWSFLMKDTSAQSSTTVAAMPTTAVTAADVGRWTHVAGSYDAAEKKLRLYVDGVPVSQVDRTATPWGRERQVRGGPRVRPRRRAPTSGATPRTARARSSRSAGRPSLPSPPHWRVGSSTSLIRAAMQAWRAEGRPGRLTRSSSSSSSTRALDLGGQD
jgi:hypothetical protein